MSAITQEQAVDPGRIGERDKVCFWRDARWDDLECLSATFVQHEYSLHTHDTYVIGVIESGVEEYRLKGVEHRAVAGDVCLVNPGELHDGRPGGNGYRYRMFYPSIDLMAEVRGQVTERHGGGLHFREALVEDPEVFRLLSGAHRTLEDAPTHLERDSAFLEAASLLIRRHADLDGPEIGVGREDRAVATVQDFVEDNLAEDLDLKKLAALVGFSPYRLIRTFRKAIGQTPHAWVTGRRIAKARRLLSMGDQPANVAVDCGFYDQAHLTRLFKSVHGVTPGHYRAAFLS
ncbi:AraC family transcriptional regulator [Rhodospirillaceae bacterium KN72]|uniref:AraC family transcriptional regulator n=1 Tax=Pacificispira spongiicola TaxID=2729598 RepID=A0A7Y0E194_9PROT|nr:AraC family transcriptional regulator [Pacificispira spongiicola]NMM44581.1 AraC family transcriptional regulator [Pacificispira spongiicola]